jgi:DNA-binding MarR family transcriptional regulator
MSEIIRNMTEVARCGVQYRTEQLEAMGLKACHPSYLKDICDNPGISQDKLAQRICINKSNVARQAAILEEQGFIIRRPSKDDKRVMELHPTEKTLELMPRINEILTAWEDCLTADLSEEEKECMAVMLNKMRGRAAKWMEDK